jgi:hypothetical protein
MTRKIIRYLEPTSSVQLVPDPIPYLEPTSSVQLVPDPIPYLEPTSLVQLVPDPIPYLEPTSSVSSGSNKMWIHSKQAQIVARSVLNFKYLCTYDLYGPVRNALMREASITWASGRGLGPGNREFFGPCEMASSRLSPLASSPPTPPPPPHPELIRNQQQTVRCLKGRSDTGT